MNKTVLLIDALACGFNIESAAKLAKMDLKEASKAASEHGDAIDARRDEISKQSDIMLPSRRWQILSEAARLGLEGYPVATSGGVKYSASPAIAIQAVKVANDMTQEAPANDSMNVTQVVEEMFSELVQTYGDPNDAWAMIEAALPEYGGVIQQVRRNHEKKVTEEKKVNAK